MKETQNPSLESIRRGIWAILGVLLLMFGFDHTSIGKSEAGELMTLLGLLAGMLIIAFVVGSLMFRFLIRLKKLSDAEE